MHVKNPRLMALRIHIAIALFQLFYIYTPLHEWHYSRPIVQWVTFPLIVLSGLYLAYGHRLRQQRRRTALPPAPSAPSAVSDSTSKV